MTGMFALPSTPALLATLVAALVAVAGARATELGVWYRELRKPSWQPPDWLFGPVWTVVYVCCVWSVATAWPALAPGQRTTYLMAWGANILANVWWSVLFFRRRRPDWALREVVVLWLSIVGVMAASWTSAPLASLQLLPYLLWVSFASVLNAAVVRLNAPFPER